MLSRVADSLYWMSRYIERSEHTCRLIEVNLKQMLDESPEVSGKRWERVVNCLRTDPPSRSDREAWTVATWMMFDKSNPDSVASCVAAARENARQVREMISADLWETLNRLHLYVKSCLTDAAAKRDPHEFLRHIKHEIHVLHGIADSTVVHGEGWMFLMAGKNVERAAATTALLSEHVQDFLAQQIGQGAEGFLHWVGVLRSCTAFEAYTKTYTAEVRPGRVLEFLLLSPIFPRSVRFCISSVRKSLESIEFEHGTKRGAKALKAARRLESLLDFLQVEDMMDETLRLRLAEIEQLCGMVHSALEDAYIFYENAPSEIRGAA
ncbi:MAG: alpha-E domain-containing protein [Fibrobacterota bacterium]|jgi:uncharacterized alpha-E superfamily protein|nr:alpha-E domain-containing protein [Fibrobacterota bacterium]QQS06418.1 MAG: alpha-E domain-containing protein [Fibrobacterota bacterium]